MKITSVNNEHYIIVHTFNTGRRSIVVRAHASRAEGLRLESDSMP